MTTDIRAELDACRSRLMEVAPIAALIHDDHAERIIGHAHALELDGQVLAHLLDWRTQWLDTTETPCGCDHASASSPAVPR